MNCLMPDYRLKSTRRTPLLWEFLISVLQDKECQNIIRWTDKPGMAFRIVKSTEVAMLWGEIKGKPNMDENKLRRAIRQYYKSGIMNKVKGQKGGYKFENIPYNPLSYPDNDTNVEPVYEGFSNLTDENTGYKLEDMLTNPMNDDNNDEEELNEITNINTIHMLQHWMEGQKNDIFCIANGGSDGNDGES